MKKGTSIRSNFLMIIVIFAVTMTMFFLAFPEIPIKYYILFIWNCLMIFYTFLNGLLKGLVAAMISIFIYGSYLIYENLTYGFILLGYMDLMWIVIYVASAYFTGYFANNLNKILEDIDKNNELLDKVALLDYETGYGNMKNFHSDLKEEMNESKRFKEDLSILVLKIKFYDDFQSIHGKKVLAEIIKQISVSIEDVVRIYDKKYRLAKDTFAIISPKNNIEGAKVVKRRLNEKLATIKITSINEELSFNYKIGVVQYDFSDIDTIELRERAYKDMEYDVG